MAQFTELII